MGGIGDIFGSRADRQSSLSRNQRGISQLFTESLADIFRGNDLNALFQSRPGTVPLFGGSENAQLLQNLMRAPSRSNAALQELLSGSPTDSSAIEASMLRSFDRRVAPRIRQEFGRHGALLGSKRGEAVGEALGDVQGQIGTLQAGLRESARNRQLQAVSIPLQQALGQIQGFGALTQQQVGQQQFNQQFLENQRRFDVGFPFGAGSGFTGQGQTNTFTSPGIGQQGLQLAGKLIGGPNGLGSGNNGIFGRGGIFG